MPIATITWYNGLNDKYGSVTAKPNPNGKFLAIQGITIAVDPKVIPYGSWVVIPDLALFSEGGDGRFYAHDTGTAVVARTASVKRGRAFPVIDVYANVKTERELFNLGAKYGETAEYLISTHG